MRRRKRDGVDEAKTVLFFGANVISGILECIDGVERGEPVLEAASKAVKRGKARARAVQSSETKVTKPKLKEPTVVDAEFVEEEDDEPRKR